MKAPLPPERVTEVLALELICRLFGSFVEFDMLPPLLFHVPVMLIVVGPEIARGLPPLSVTELKQ
jgi:hypothetical protein